MFNKLWLRLGILMLCVVLTPRLWGNRWESDSVLAQTPGKEIVTATGVKGSYADFLYKLGQRETGRQDPPYNIENWLGYIGKYQFGESLLIDLGYYKAKIYFGNGARKNYWHGTWTGKDGIYSKADFLKNKNNVQEIAIREACYLNWNRIQSKLEKQGHSLQDYLGHRQRGILITTTGILAAAHLRGASGVVDLLVHNKESKDHNGTSILTYLREFGGYDTR